MKKRIPESKWEWFGLPAHFLCANSCRFHMATKVGRYLISSVGFYIPSCATDEWCRTHPLGEKIGCDRLFETFVFKAGPRCEGKCNCGVPQINGSEIDSLPANDPGTAQKNHMKLCKKWATK